MAQFKALAYYIYRKDQCRPLVMCVNCKTGWARDEFYWKLNFKYKN